MPSLDVDILVIGGGGAGLRAAIAAAEWAEAEGQPRRIGLLSKVYPMRSHTVAAEGGAAAVTRDDDSLDDHFNDTVAGGDWLCEQSVVDYFVRHAREELVRMEHWGCPWSRQPDGSIQVRRFGGMKIERTWFAADKTGFHMLHTLFQTSLRFPAIQRLDEYFILDLVVEDGRVAGAIALQLSTGRLWQIRAGAVILATGGAGRVFRFNTNGGIVTGDGMALAYRHGVPLRDMEFVQYHPTGLPGSGILITEACRGEGGILLNAEGYRYLQDYGLGPETPLGEPRNKYMELGPRDRLSQAFWHEQQKGRTGRFRESDVVYLDLRHLGADYLKERLPLICELAASYVNIDPLQEAIPIRPAVHYTMGGIETDPQCQTRIQGLFAVGECASVGLHGANRLGSNSLSELLVFGRVAGETAARASLDATPIPDSALDAASKTQEARLAALTGQAAGSGENWVALRNDMQAAMEAGCGIYRDEAGLENCLSTLQGLQARFQQVQVRDQSRVYNTELLACLEVGSGLDVAESMCLAALARRESRGAHQRLDSDCRARDDEHFLKHSLVSRQPDGSARLDWQNVDTRLSPPGARVYGGAASPTSQDTQQP